MPGLLRETHVFSIAAKLLLDNPENQDSWIENIDWIVDGCRELMLAFDTPEEIDDYLTRTPEELFDYFSAMFTAAVVKARERGIADEEAASRHNNTRRGARARKDERQLSDEFVIDSGVEDEESSDIDNLAEEEEEYEKAEIDALRFLTAVYETSDKGTKRKAEDDGRDDETGKKQETCTV
ncbi:hypothetical protein FGADI_5298 [Fusarium gaditjirri]|uniref:Uncharacterized protein n=1 Tax=Fusarium gaditjirri TaxID=282569 RepID=A0A8H4TB68_9HYPO|nr:hypothetical protein FGADI_5298 [Fusarium gaditjirri]